MVSAPRARNPQAVLFACALNAVRSPMAASLLQQMFPQLYVKSAGARKGELDPFAVSVMAELGQDISSHKPTTFEELDLAALGSLTIQRASHVEPDATGLWWADLTPVQGPCLGPFARRSEALIAEVQWLEAHWLTPNRNAR